MSSEENHLEMLRRIMYIGQLLANVPGNPQNNRKSPKLPSAASAHEGTVSSALSGERVRPSNPNSPAKK